MILSVAKESGIEHQINVFFHKWVIKNKLCYQINREKFDKPGNTFSANAGTIGQ